MIHGRSMLRELRNHAYRWFADPYKEQEVLQEMFERSGKRAKAFARRILPKEATREQIWLAWAGVGWFIYTLIEFFTGADIKNMVISMFYFALCVSCILFIQEYGGK